MATRILILQILFCCSIIATATVYNYNETSEGSYGGFRSFINKDFVIGGLFPVHDYTDSVFTKYGDLEMLEAMLFAIDRVNNDMSLLPNLTIGYDVRDSRNDTPYGAFVATDIIRQAIDDSYTLLGIVGPAHTSVALSVAATLEQFQVPLIGYGSTSATLSNKDRYKYFLRTIPSTNLQVNAMIDVVHHFGWEYVNVIFNDDEYGVSQSDAFINGVMQQSICIHTENRIPKASEVNYNQFSRIIKESVRTLLNSKASVIVVFTDERTVWALFEELTKTNSSRKFAWIASDRWANSTLVRDSFPEIAKRTFGFLPRHTEYVREFDNYFSQLNSTTNIRDPFFQERIFYNNYCVYEYDYGSEYEYDYGSRNEYDNRSENEYNYGSGNEYDYGTGNEYDYGTGSEYDYGSGMYEYGDHYDCPDDLTDVPSYSQNKFVPFVIDAVYTFAHALQNFLNDNCDSPVRWNCTTQRCDGMRLNLTGENLLEYLYNVTFCGIQNYTVRFDENGDPPGVYEIINLQINDNGQYEYVSVGLWNSSYTENALILNNTDGIEKIDSTCSKPCRKGSIRIITNPSCLSCFECIPCVGPTYSMNSSDTNCSLCSDNHWGNNPLSGSTHCVPVEVRHLDFSSGWSITSMCIASITLIILAVITVIFIMTWNTPVVKSSGREQMVMLLIGIGACCFLTYIVVAPPSTGVCVFQRIGVWLCFSLAFGALLIKIIRVARIFYSIKFSPKTLRFTDSVHQVIFTMAIVAGQLVVVAVGLVINLPAVEKDPEVVITSYEQVGEAPDIIETCQQPHTAILVFLLAYNFLIIVGCTILGLMTMGFPDNFNEAKHVMFTSFTLMVIWVLFVPLYFYTEEEFQPGVLALGIVLSAFALMAGVFFPRVFIIIFQKHRNTKEHVQSTGTGTSQAINFSKASQQSKTLINYS